MFSARQNLPSPTQEGRIPWPESRIPVCAFLMKYLKEETQGKMWPYLQEPSIQREKGDVCPHDPCREKSQAFSASHLIRASQNPYEVSGMSIFQIRQLRLRKVTRSRNVSAAQSSLAPRSQRANPGWRGLREGREKQRLDANPGGLDHVLWRVRWGRAPPPRTPRGCWLAAEEQEGGSCVTLSCIA